MSYADSDNEAKAPTVTIGMPVYNGEKYIAEAIDSLLSQTFTDFELIISDNASTDKTGLICREYANQDERITYIRHNKNRGALQNFQFVLDEAKGKYFMWAAHDDLWAPDFLEKSTDLLSNSDINFVFPAFELRSILLGISRNFNSDLFRFIEERDRKTRVISFLSTHFLSHSANIVYSLFRTPFLRDICKRQNIGNDGVLGAVLLGEGYGAINNSLFIKRYPLFWPGLIPYPIVKWTGWLRNIDIDQQAKNNISTARRRLLELFPEYKREIEYIYGHYRPYVSNTNYKVCNMAGLALKG